jgi:DnaK suppressor protein
LPTDGPTKGALVMKKVSSKKETVMKFEKLFLEEKRKLLYAYKANQDEFTIASDDLSDEVDLSTAELEQTMRVRMRSREALFLKKIDEALERIVDGSFGDCIDCGDEIEIRRLEARPTATHCLSCKEAQEHEELASAEGRKHKSLGTNTSLRIA